MVFATWRIIEFLFAIGGIFFVLVIPTINGVVHGFQTGEWTPLLKATGGAVFSSDQIIKENVNFLSDEKMIKAHPDRYEKKFVEHLKSEIIMSLIIMVVWILIFYWVLSKLTKRIIGETMLNFAIIFVILLLALLIVALMEFAYSLIIPPHKFVVPLGGLGSLIWNYQIWGFTGFDTGLTFGDKEGAITYPIEAKDYETDKPFEAVKNPDGSDANVTALGRPKKLVEFFCQTDNDCITYFSNQNAKCQASSGVCYS